MARQNDLSHEKPAALSFLLTAALVGVACLGGFWAITLALATQP